MIPDKKTREKWHSDCFSISARAGAYAADFCDAIDELESQRDELLAVCKDTERFLAKIGGDNPQPGSHYAKLKDAIAKCQKGGDAP